MIRRSHCALLTCFFLMCTGSLAILKIADPDAWIHLSMGRLIWTLKGLPVHEPFVPALQGEPFSYSSWFFGVVYYGAYRLFDTFGVVLLKAGTVVAIFAVLLKDALNPFRKRFAAISVLIVIAVCIRSRFVERPDTFLMLFLPYSIMALNLYLFENNKRHLYALPVIHLIWANSHSSINLMFIPFLAVFVGGGVGSFLAKRGVKTGMALSLTQARTIALVFAASLACALVSPYGVHQFTFASQFLKLDVYKQQINELLPTTWMIGFRWFYVLAAFTLASFISAGRRVSLADLARILPFICLAFLSRRFVFVFAVVAAPILIRNVSATLDRIRPTRDEPQGLLHWPVVVAVWFWVAGVSAAAVAQVGPFRDAGFAPGFGFDLSRQPEGALAYMDRRNITGRVMDIPMSWGQYIIWRDSPRRIPFVDGRGYLPMNLVENYFSEVGLDEMAATYAIDAFLVSYPKNTLSKIGVTGNDLALDLPGWVLVYWDDVALVYLRQGGKYDGIIQMDRFKVVKPANGVKWLETVAQDPLQRDMLVQELQRNIAETGSSRGYLLLGKAFLESGRYRQAIELLLHVSGKYINLGNVSADIARCYENLGDLSQAVHWYRDSLQKIENSDTHFRIGALLLKSGDASGAVPHLERAVSLKPDNVGVYPVLAGAYRVLGKEPEAAKALQEYQKAMLSTKGEDFFNLGVKAYLDGRFQDAADAFGRAIAANPRHALSYVNLGFAQFDLGQTDKAFAMFQQALNLDPKSALAHYGVAMIYKKRGDTVSAHTHWKRYLELEPSGFYARQVKKELENSVEK